jgi:hypothetical protein
MDSVEAYELLRCCRPFRDRLAEAEGQVAKSGLEAERRWVSEAIARVPEAGAFDEVLRRAAELPELADARAELAESMQAAWVDALERLLAGITFHVGARVPLIEALFPHQKFAVLRRAGRDVAQPYQTDFERRLKTSYVARTLSEPEYAFAAPVLEAVSHSFHAWQKSLEPTSVSETEAEAIRNALIDSAEGFSRAMRQARLLAEAALVPVGVELDLAVKPKRRARPVAAAAPVPAPAPEPEIAAEPPRPARARKAKA